MEDPDMESIGLDNLRQYLTDMYTRPAPAVATLFTGRNPALSVSFVGSLLNSGSCPKCVTSWWLVVF